MIEEDPSTAFDHDAIDDVIHGRVRLAAVAYLASVESAEFTILRRVVNATDGNLSVHLRKLEDAGYVAVDKRFVGRKPQTVYALTPAGREAFRRYVERLAGLLGTEKPR
ncbi:MAG: transcriptional regulator [Proteobacteria bacterium]|nr:transcriptional regulator [Pseudomonadota bacterium]MBI3497782.1 transcriptional regulator [Pseudomonadota bacterium]